MHPISTSHELVEREHALASITAHLDAAANGAGATLILDAPPGLGKSVLLERAARGARERGFQVLRARADEPGQHIAYGVVHQLVARALRDPELQDELLAPLRTALSGESATTPPSVPGQVANAFWWLLGSLVESGPVLVIVDDLHWADAASLDALAYVAARIDDMACSLFAAQRTGVRSVAEESSARISAAAVSTVETIDLLSAKGARAVAHQVVPGLSDAAADRAYAATGGNPFLLTELVRHADGDLDTPLTESADATPTGAVPPRVLADMQRRVGSGGPDLAMVGAAAAVLGVRATVARMAAVSGVTPDRAEAIVDELVRGDVFELHEDRVAFRHPLLRAAMLSASVDEATRRQLAKHAADVLQRDGAGIAEVASILLDAPIAGDPTTSERLIAGASAALDAGAPRNAIRLLDRAVAEPIADPDERAGAWVLSGRAHAFAGDVMGALEQWNAALEVATDPIQRSNLRAAIANVLVGISDLDGVCATFNAAAAELDGVAGMEQRALMLRARGDAFGRFSGAAFSDSDVLADAVPASPEDDTHEDRTVLASLATAYVFANSDAELAQRLGRRALAGTKLLEEDTADGQMLYVATGALTWTDDYDTVLPVLDAAVADARTRGSVLGHATASFCRGGSRVRQGDLLRGAADLEAAVEARHDGWIAYLPYAGYYAAKAYLAIGDAERAISLVEASVPGGDAAAWGPLEAFAHATLAIGAQARGDLEGAYRSMLDGSVAVGNLGIGSVSIAEWRQDAVEFAVELGRADEVVTLAQDALADARAFGAPRPLGIALRAAALVAPDQDTSAELLDEAVDVLGRGQVRWELARTLSMRAERALAAGDDEAAQPDLARALELASACGGRPLAAKLTEQLNLLGVVAPSAPSATSKLTPGELRVVELALAGQSNREIAQSLFVTVKAVEWHLSNAYRKLGISGRRDLAAAFQR